MKYTLAGIGLLLLIITGCNDLDTPEVGGFGNNTNPQTAHGQKDWGESLFGPGPANYGVAQHNQQDRVDNFSEINSTGKSYRSPQAPHPTHADDQERMENIVYDYPNVVPGMVVIMGGQAWVNIMHEDHPNPGVSQEENNRRVQEIEERLIQANPRYNYRVIVNDWR
ncbi:hypothetical protein J2S74_004631 [Evansella vedderi]|uniref:Uncharacterized protein n=1 Tax=Evansella vedderi TaxID=38282 RepID=A0ABU0A113_9BACI|nr:hypothetical protein [Evansella vedderi]MDQ0257173.1 hypothetical protein [Evansella vedderi]